MRHKGVILGSSRPPGPPQDPEKGLFPEQTLDFTPFLTPGDPSWTPDFGGPQPRKNGIYGTNPRFYPILGPGDPPPGPPDPDLDFLEKWGGRDPQNKVKSHISGTKRYF